MSRLTDKMIEYEIARIRAGLPPLPSSRIRQIAKAKIALADHLKGCLKINFYPDPTPTEAFTKAYAEARAQRMMHESESAPGQSSSGRDQLEARLWSLGCTAFWLDPDRWHGVPMAPNGHMEPFWMHLDTRPDHPPLCNLTGSSAQTYLGNGGPPPPYPPPPPPSPREVSGY